MVAEEARQIMSELGFRTINEMVGRVDALDVSDTLDHYKAQKLDLSPILTPARKPHPDVDVYCTMKQDHGIEKVLDNKLIERCQPAIQKGEKVRFSIPIQNTDRTTCTMLSHTVSKQWGVQGLKDDTIHIQFKGSAGQSLCAWLVHGITVELEGDANDYVGKGLSGGHLIIYPPKESTFVAEQNVLIGNVALYGATSGKAFFRGLAAERFCVRNSGASAVIEGVGDHACEYMTGGRAVILGPTGRNFAAGMSGGIAYVHDPNDQLLTRCNMATVDLEKLEQTLDIEELRILIKQHQEFTGSTVAWKILSQWEKSITEFVKVMPLDYKRVLGERMDHDEELDVTVHDGQEVSHG